MTEPTLSQSNNTDTPYIVLRLDDSPGSEGRWDRIGPEVVPARDAVQAVRDVAGKFTSLNGGTFVAVPARSWKPVKVTPKVETTLVIEDAS